MRPLVVLLTISACSGYFSTEEDPIEDDGNDGVDGGGAPVGTSCNLAVTSQHPSGPNPRGLIVADLDNDMHLDLVIPNETNLLQVLYGAGGGAFTRTDVQTPHAAPISVAVADFNEDGRADMALSNGTTISFVQGTSSGSFELLASAVPFGAYHLVAADFDGDGHQDLLASSETGIRLFPGTGTGTFDTTQPEMAVGKTFSFDVIDIDGDGALDLVSISAWQLTVRASSTGVTRTYATGGVYPRDLAVGDLDGDIDLDIAIVNADIDTVRLFFNDAASFEMHVDLSTDVPAGSDGAGMGSGSNLGDWVPWNVAIGDLTGDGEADILVLIQPYAPVGDTSKMVVLERSGQRQIVQRECAIQPRPLDVALGDFAGDTRTDAIIVAAPYDASAGGKVMIVEQTP